MRRPDIAEPTACDRPIRLVVVVSHPIQYFTPLYRRLAAAPELDLKVLFASRIGLEVRRDVKMGVDMAWAADLTAGFPHAFLDGAEAIQATSFFEIDNPGVGAALRREDPDVIVLHGYAAMTNLKALAWARLHRRPVVMLSDASVDSSRRLLGRFGKRLLAPWLLAQFAAFLTMSDRGEAYLARNRVARERLFRTPVTIDEGFWRARRQRPEARRRGRAALGVGHQDVLLLSVGKLYPGKRVQDVIAAAVGLDASVRLVVAGDGVQRAQLERQADDAGVKAIFPGFVNIDALPDLYAAADLLVHAAEIEQYGMVLLEAAVVGLPLIASDRIGAVGPTSIAQPGVNALVHPCGDVPALRAAMRRLIAAPAERARLAAASLQISQAHDGAASVAAVVEACRYARS